jgi:hypothetical protein
MKAKDVSSSWHQGNEISPNSKHNMCVRVVGVAVGWFLSERKSLGNVPKQPARNEGAQRWERGRLRGDKKKGERNLSGSSHGKVGADWDTSFLFPVCKKKKSFGGLDSAVSCLTDACGDPITGTHLHRRQPNEHTRPNRWD